MIVNFSAFQEGGVYQGSGSGKLPGIDIHKEKAEVCLAHEPLDKSPKFEIRTFSTISSDLEEPMSWLKKYKM